MGVFWLKEAGAGPRGFPAYLECIQSLIPACTIMAFRAVIMGLGPLFYIFAGI